MARKVACPSGKAQAACHRKWPVHPLPYGKGNAHRQPQAVPPRTHGRPRPLRRRQHRRARGAGVVRMSDTPQKRSVRSNLPKLTEETIWAKTTSGDTPLHRAARKGQFDLVPSHLFSAELFLVANNYGETPLHVAARHGHLAQVPVQFLTHKTLTCKRSPPDAPNGTFFTASGKKAQTRTVLHVAAYYKHIDQLPREFLTLPYLGNR